MSKKEHVALLKQGVEVWNEWRTENPDVTPDLSNANLSGVILGDRFQERLNMSDADLSYANLGGANLRGADLSSADLHATDLSTAILHGANLHGANLRAADLSNAILSNANLHDANLGGANLRGANLSRARLIRTVLGDTDLTGAKGLETCRHIGPSIIDHQTLQRSGPLPLNFLRGIGLPDNLIDYLPSLLNQPIQFFSCFISYSGKDQKFADRLHADLQNKGVRCWFAPHDLPIGAKTWDAIDEAIRLRDKVLLILSRNAIESDWVEDEVTKAFAEERTRKQLVLFPIRLDDTVMKTDEAWAGKLRDNRNIGDFRRWKDHDVYQKALERVLRDLKVAQAGP